MSYLGLRSCSWHLLLMMKLFSLRFNGSLLWLRVNILLNFVKILLISSYEISSIDGVVSLYHLNTIDSVVTVILGVESLIHVSRMTLWASSSTAISNISLPNAARFDSLSNFFNLCIRINAFLLPIVNKWVRYLHSWIIFNILHISLCSFLRGGPLIRTLWLQHWYPTCIGFHYHFLIKGRVKRISSELALHYMNLTTWKRLSSVTVIKVLIIYPILHSITACMKILWTISFWSWSRWLGGVMWKRFILLVLFVLYCYLCCYWVDLVSLVPQSHPLNCCNHFHIVYNSKNLNMKYLTVIDPSKLVF